MSAQTIYGFGYYKDTNQLDKMTLGTLASDLEWKYDRPLSAR